MSLNLQELFCLEEVAFYNSLKLLFSVVQYRLMLAQYIASRGKCIVELRERELTSSGTAEKDLRRTLEQENNVIEKGGMSKGKDIYSTFQDKTLEVKTAK
jgi:hypothetical protein